MDRLVCSLSPFSEANFRCSVFALKDKIEDTVSQQLWIENNAINGPESEGQNKYCYVSYSFTWIVSV